MIEIHWENHITYRSVLDDEKIVKSISRIRGMADVPVFEREARVKYFVTFNNISEQYKWYS